MHLPLPTDPPAMRVLATCPMGSLDLPVPAKGSQVRSGAGRPGGLEVGGAERRQGQQQGGLEGPLGPPYGNESPNPSRSLGQADIGPGHPLLPQKGNSRPPCLHHVETSAPQFTLQQLCGAVEGVPRGLRAGCGHAFGGWAVCRPPPQASSPAPPTPRDGARSGITGKGQPPP